MKPFQMNLSLAPLILFTIFSLCAGFGKTTDKKMATSNTNRTKATMKMIVLMLTKTSEDFIPDDSMFFLIISLSAYS